MSACAPGAAPLPRVPRRILPLIVLSQFAGTSLWFAPNGVMGDLQREWGLAPDSVGALTSAVQLGFIAGTLLFALTLWADRFPPRRVFFLCALLGALSNLAALWLPPDLAALSFTRFLTGVCLAGIYPVGMKIAAGWYREGLGAALGLMIGALVVGTALPHGLEAVVSAQWHLPWQAVLITVSCVAALGGVILMAGVPDGPHVARFARGDPRVARPDLRALAVILRDRRLRASVLGYFGHMWELYAMMVMVPTVIEHYLRTGFTPGVSMLSFLVIAGGGLGCAVGGLIAWRFRDPAQGSAWVASAQLATSGACCLLAPWMLQAPAWLFAGWLVVWGVTVAGDSPQFSALTARNAPPTVMGSVLTFVNCIGFAISIVTILAITALARVAPLESLLPWLAIGPVLGVIAMRPLLRRAS